MIGYVFRAITGTSPLQKALRRHFGRVALGKVATAAREFPVTSRVDLQAALEDMFRSRADARLLGIFSPNFHESPTLAQVFAGGPFMMNIGPLQHDEIDIGERLPVRCLRNGLWLARHNGVPFSPSCSPSQCVSEWSGACMSKSPCRVANRALRCRRTCSQTSSAVSAAVGRTADASSHSSARRIQQAAVARSKCIVWLP